MPKKISFFSNNLQALNKKYLFIITALLLAVIFLLPQPGQISLASPEPSYIKTIGEAGVDYAHSIRPTSDGGYIMTGYTSSYGSERSALIIKLDSSENLSWAKTVGEVPLPNCAWNLLSIRQTSDGGYIAVGNVNLFATSDRVDIAVVKFDSLGNVLWTKHIDRDNYVDYAYDIQQTSDGGYIMTGITYNHDGTRSWSTGSAILVIKLNSLGDRLWARTIGGEPNRDDQSYSIQQTSDGGYIIAGMTNSYPASNPSDVFIVKLNSLGFLDWTRSIGGTHGDTASSIRQTSDGGYIIAGTTHSYGAGGSDMFIIKLNNLGNFSWARAIGGAGEDQASAYYPSNTIQQTSDGDYIIAGITNSYGAGNYDAFIVKINSLGNLLWARTIGGTNSDAASSIQQALDGGYIITGRTDNYGAGLGDVFLAKLDSTGNITNCPLISNISPSISPVFPVVTSPPVVLFNDNPPLNIASLVLSSVSRSPSVNNECPLPMSTDPTVTTQVATGVATSSATLNMDYTVGDYSPVEVRFIWKKTVDPSWENTAWVSRAADGSYSEDLIGLVASTEYHFKAQLRYNETEINGATSTFTTLSVAPPPPPPPPPPGTCDYHNVWGWAWANMESPSHDPTIGWISFSCRNCDTDGDGTIDHPQCPTGSTADYGVDIDSVTGQFSGHAWSGGGVDAAGNEVPVLGWLSFNITETGPPPGDPVFGTHLAQVSTTTGDVSGWARFLAACDSVPCTSSGPCANCGGWDGWIKLGNLPHQPWHAGVGQQVYIDFGAGPPSDFHGWAWGDDVVGWLSFNCANEGCGPSDYKVMTGLSFAPPPSLPYIESATSTDEYCNIFAGVGRVDFGWTYKHDDGYNQASYHLQVATDSTFGTILVDYQPSDPQIVSPNGKGSSAILIVEDPGTNPNCGVGDSFEDRCVAYGPPYSWRVKVKDENDNWSADWGPDPPASFATPAHAYPWVDFSWFPDRPNINQEVQFTDNSTPFGGASMAGRTWQFQDGSPANLTGPNPTTTFTAIAPSPGNRVDLYACDNTPLAQGGPYCCPKDDYIKVTFPLPEYREVRPRSQLDNFLARIAGIFR